jgi:membrane-bound serine protease (ClpP class)
MEQNAALIILNIDTPGGLDLSMRDIIRDIIASSVPVIVYVGPSGARAASAGTYILYAAHIAAMAPGTNLGAATPVQLGGLPDLKPPMPEATPETKQEQGSKEEDAEDGAGDSDSESIFPVNTDSMTKKIMNDAIAYIRSLAEMRGRNVEWAELAVREAASLSSEQALSQQVIDIVATDIDDLLEQANGWQVNINGRNQILDTRNLTLEHFEPDWRNKLLTVITDPNVAYILMLLGIYGLFFEFVNPGYVLPGVTGAICLLLALYALQVLPVNYAGLGLILLGIMFMVAEVFAPSFGALGIGGVVAFVFGSVILFDTEGSQFQVALPLILTIALITAGFFLVVIRMMFAAHRKPVVSGVEEMLGSIGEVLEDFDHKGRIRIHGESWQGITETPLKCGDRVKVTNIDGLVLKVELLKEEGK